MKRILAFILAVVVLITGCNKIKQAEIISPPAFIRPVQASSFISEKDFKTLLAKYSGTKYEIEGRVVSGVLPHHLLASDLIIGFMEVLARQEVKTIILVGPNHTNAGAKVISGQYDWQTPAGLIQTESGIVQALLDQGTATENNQVLSTEHSIGGLLPFIRHFLPEAQIVPIILHHGFGFSEANQLLTALEPYLNEETVLLASVDFSHYLTRQEATLKDKETLQAMRYFNYPALFRMGNDYLDSPASLTIAFKAAEREGIREFQVLDNTNSGYLLNNDRIETTSYFTLAFLKP